MAGGLWLAAGVASEASRGRGTNGGRWGRVLAMTSMLALQSVHALISGQAGLGGLAVAGGSSRGCGRTLGTGCGGYNADSIKGAAPVRAAGTVEVRSANSPSEGRGAHVRDLVQSRTGTGHRGKR